VKTKRKIVITGASGLLGKTLVDRFKFAGWMVLAHYFNNRGVDSVNCKWMYGNFSSKKEVNVFLDSNNFELSDCSALVNCYGPITYGEISDISSTDFEADFHGNLIVVNEIIRYLLRFGNLKSVVNIGFEGVGDMKPYKNILSYAIAKNGLLLLTKSYDKAYPDVKFSIISPPSLVGGKYSKISGQHAIPEDIAEKVFEKINNGKSDI